MTFSSSAPHRDALLALCDRLPSDLPWAVTASENLALRGFDVSPGDVDLATTADGVYRIEELFSDHVTRDVVPPEEAETETIRSHFGALSLHGTEVELMGDVEHHIDGEWVADPPVAEVREFRTVEGREVPVIPLDVEAAGYRARGEPDRAAAIEARLEAARDEDAERATNSAVPEEARR
ncbi:nucleotidyltransferase domain-containing protein [Halomarina salina]|uniref:Nucleotidyltransferase domain-containing protein n=1 Tax=Halomarina salina TaxID=1872699 RepID=A0ABD5RL92_9EURY|nr:hypothetical protein [Halomarina salina]